MFLEIKFEFGVD
jgi:hypothetical protein